MKDSSKLPKWTKRDLIEFDLIIKQTDSGNQMDRIKGRLKYSKFEERFSKEELDQMWELIK